MRNLVTVLAILLIIGAGLAIAKTGNNDRSNPENVSPQSISEIKGGATGSTATGMQYAVEGSGIPCTKIGSGMPCAKTGSGATVLKMPCH